MLIKICGVTTADDARFALDAGADWVGLNLVGGPRRIEPSILADIVPALDNPESVVVLLSFRLGFVDADLLTQLRDLGIKRVQLYGDDPAGAIRSVGNEGMDAIVVQHVRGEGSLKEVTSVLDGCGAHRPSHVLLDAAMPGKLGGTGVRADWDAIGDAASKGWFRGWPPFILAGGLNAENVAEAIGTVRPAGVDVSSGVEAEFGRKDLDKVRRFIEAARAVR